MAATAATCTNLVTLLDNLVKRTPREAGPATDSEISDFINLFMRRTAGRYNANYSSYTLKHLAERVIGYLFNGSTNYYYVSNEQIKKIMLEAGFGSKNADEQGTNLYFDFAWKPGMEDIVTAYNNVHLYRK